MCFCHAWGTASCMKHTEALSLLELVNHPLTAAMLGPDCLIPRCILAGVGCYCHGTVPQQQQRKEASQGQDKCHVLCMAAPPPDLCWRSPPAQR